MDADIGEIVSDVSSDDVESDEDSDYPIKLFLGQNPEPLLFDAEPETGGEETGEWEYLNNIIYTLESSCLPHQRLHFEDGDGESVFIRVGDLALLQVPLWILDHDELEARSEDEDDEGEE